MGILSTFAKSVFATCALLTYGLLTGDANDSGLSISSTKLDSTNSYYDAVSAVQIGKRFGKKFRGGEQSTMAPVQKKQDKNGYWEGDPRYGKEGSELEAANRQLLGLQTMREKNWEWIRTSKRRN
jgi:hypothetical protein